MTNEQSRIGCSLYAFLDVIINKVKPSLIMVAHSSIIEKYTLITRSRTRIEIIAQFLQAASTHYGVTKTRFMYRTFLPYMQVKEYLAILLRNELVEYDLPAKTYKTTHKGLKFLEVYQQLEDLKVKTMERDIVEAQ